MSESTESINLLSLDVSRVILKTPQRKVAEGNVYYQLDIKYMGEDKSESNLYLQFPEMTSFRIRESTKKNKTGKEIISFYMLTQLSGDTCKEFEEVKSKIVELYSQLCNQFKVFAPKTGIDRFNGSDDPRVSQLISIQKDKDTGMPLPGRSESIFLEAIKYRSGGGTTFKIAKTGPSGEIIQDVNGDIAYEIVPWAKFASLSFKHCPEVSFSSMIIASGKITFRHSVTSSILTSIQPSSGKFRQGATLKSIVAKDPGSMAKLKRDLEMSTEESVGEGDSYPEMTHGEMPPSDDIMERMRALPKLSSEETVTFDASMAKPSSSASSASSSSQPLVSASSSSSPSATKGRIIIKKGP